MSSPTSSLLLAFSSVVIALICAEAGATPTPRKVVPETEITKAVEDATRPAFTGDSVLADSRAATIARLADEQADVGYVTVITGTIPTAPQPKPTKYLDNKPVELAFVTAGAGIRFERPVPQGEKIEVPVALTIGPAEAVPSANLLVIAGGEGFELDGSSQTARETKYLPDLTQIGWIERRDFVTGSQVGQLEEGFTLRIGPLNWGYIYAELEVIRDSDLPEYYSTILYFASSEHRILFSYGSLEELAEFLSRRQSAVSNVELKRMRERGEFARIEPDMLKEPMQQELVVDEFLQLVSDHGSPCGPPKFEASCSGKTVSGEITFKKGENWPVTDAIVRLLQEEDGTRDRCLAETRSGDSGTYQFCLDDPADGSYSVVVLTSGDHVVVAGCHRSNNPEEDCQEVVDNLQDAFAVRSEAFRFDAETGPKIEINLPNDNQWGADAAKALSVYEAVNLANKALRSKNLRFPTGGSLPGKVRVAYGSPRIGTSTPIWLSGDGNIEVSFVDQVDWDVIQHEFAHVVQHYGGFAPELGGKHRLNVNLCDGMYRGTDHYGSYDHGKGRGTQLAWTEAWATWLSTWLQQSMRGRFSPDFESVGDLIYENSSPTAATWGYDLESFDKYVDSEYYGYKEKWLGEGNEVAVQRLLWDLGDHKDVGEPDKVELGHKKIWDLTIDNSPDRLSDFVEALLTEVDDTNSYKIRSNIGQLMVAQGISPEVKASTFRDWLLGTREIIWIPQFKCTTEDHGVTQFDLSFLDAKLREKLRTEQLDDTNPQRNGSNVYVLSSEDRIATFGRFRSGAWTVAGTDASDEKTGPYPSTHAKVHPPHILWVLLALVLMLVVVLLLVRSNRSPGT